MRDAIDDFGLVDEWGPEKIVMVSDRRTGMKGVLVIDNTARGIGKGGTRMSPSVQVTEIARLARVMTWKWAAVDVFFGGAKAGVRADPDRPDKEAIVRAFARRLGNEVPSEYVFGLDMGLTERDSAIIQDELGDRGAAVGTPSALGGVPYDEWGVTGFGVAEAAEAAFTRSGREIAGASVVIQGFGAVGGAAALRFTELGARVVAISDVDGVAFDPDGLDVAAALEARGPQGSVTAEVPCATRLEAGAELRLKADILVPAATQDVVDADLARDLDVLLVVEGANLPLTADAREVLAARGITVVPDFIANAGGVIAAAFAMEARYSPFPVEAETIFAAISSKLRTNTTQVLDESASLGETPHAAAWRLAADRVRQAMELRSPTRGGTSPGLA
jgi:glutamate dehydrogenase (NAD(P)+)